MQVGLTWLSCTRRWITAAGSAWNSRVWKVWTSKGWVPADFKFEVNSSVFWGVRWKAASRSELMSGRLSTSRTIAVSLFDKSAIELASDTRVINWGLAFAGGDSPLLLAIWEMRALTSEDLGNTLFSNNSLAESIFKEIDLGISDYAAEWVGVVEWLKLFATCAPRVYKVVKVQEVPIRVTDELKELESPLERFCLRKLIGDRIENNDGF